MNDNNSAPELTVCGERPEEKEIEKCDEPSISEATCQEVKVKTEMVEVSNGDGESDTPSTNMLTSSMVKEEEEIEKVADREEDDMKQKQEQIWNQMDEDDREQRYKRLQFLLNKSNLYTNYLLERMERQKEEADRRRERKDKKEEKKKNTTNTQKSETNIASSENQQNSQLSPVRTRGRRSGLSSPVNSSQSDAFSSQESTKKRGKKRKMEGSQEEEMKMAKKNKVDNENREPNIQQDKDSAEAKRLKDISNISETGEAADGHLGNKGEKNNSEKDQKPTKKEEDEEEKGFQEDGTPVLFTGGKLRQYQLDGFHWLRTLYENGVNGILADEMGLGKTVQCVAMMAHLVYMGVPGPYLVCAPLSTLPNWYSEFKRFAPTVPVIFYHGNKDERMRLRNSIAKRHQIREGVKGMPVVITSYEITMIDRKVLQRFEWKYLIVDEGHRIKNTHCRLIRELRLYRNTHRLLLTGTPLQNNLAELWSLLNFLLPEIFDDMGSFEAWFDVERISSADAEEHIIAEEKKRNILSMLHQILTPFMLRRLKQDVDLCIPPKKEVLVYAPMTQLQQEFYTSTVDKTILCKLEEKKSKPKIEVDSKGRPVRTATKKKINYEIMMDSDSDGKEESKKKRRSIEEDEEEIESWVQAMIDNQALMQMSEGRGSNKSEAKTSQVTIRLQNIMMQLRKCCNHPFLLEHPLDPKTGDLLLGEETVTCCGKMLLLDTMLKKLKQQGHKVLIFSQMTRMLDLIEDFCYLRNHTYCRLDGSTSVEDRQQQMESFNTDPKVFLFLLSTRAGGLGINLLGADTVIIYDSDWNPQSDLQAQDRCHRIGQTRPVVVYRYVAANTIDQRIVERAAAKRKLEKMVIHQGKFKNGMKNFNSSLKPISPQELLDLLKAKDHQMEMKGSTGEQVISDRDLECLLDRSDLYAKWELLKKAKENGTSGKQKTKNAKKSSRGNQSKEVEGVFKIIDEDTVS